jgi:hypothetical protein
MLFNGDIKTWENIVKTQANHEYLFSYYIGHKIYLNKCFNSPLRKDDLPSFAIFDGHNGLMYKDFSTGDSGDIIKFVMQKFHLSRERAIIKCLSDAFISIQSNDLIEVIPKYSSPRKNTTIGIKTINFTDSDIKYWTQYYITEKTLNLYNVKSVSHVWFNDILSWTRSDNEPIYAYLCDNKMKLYRPNTQRKDGKWAGNSTNDCIFGLDTLPLNDKLLIITKSVKDSMVLHELGFNSISPNAETTIMTNEQINLLQKRFEHIIILMDNDDPGIKAGTRYKEKYNLDTIFLPGPEKDISDYIKLNGKNKAKELINKLLNDR